MKRRGLLRPVFSCLLLAGSLWIMGFGYFIHLMPTSPPLPPPTLTEGIVVFTGRAARLQEALALFEKNKGRYLLISGVNPRSTFPNTIAHLPRRAQITLGYTAHNTRGNAEETARWVHQNAIQTLWLVTSNYHIPRSLFELRPLLPQVHIIPHGVVNKGFEHGQWWRHRSTLSLIIREYNKFLFALIRRPLKKIYRHFVSLESSS